MKQLVIIGAGGFGRELCSVARECSGFGSDFVLKGFLDDNPQAIAGFTGYPPVIGTVSGYMPEENDVFITALGNPASRRKCAAQIEAKGGEFVSLVHRSASVAQNVKIGKGSFIAQYAVVSADAQVGVHSCVFQNSVVGHDARIGDFAHVYSLCAIGGGVTIGDGTAVYPGAHIVPRRSVGAGAVVGIGSVVVNNVRAGETVFGNPARVVNWLID